MTVLVTGAAGFIGYHTARALLARGERVIGVDNLNDYYDTTLKTDRLGRLETDKDFRFQRLDIADAEALTGIPGLKDVHTVIHLAAQAGVRYSIDHPFAYGHSNLVGHLSVLELCRGMTRRPRLVYASSSSVYGANTKVPFHEDDPVEQPVSLYAATKRSNELLSESYSRLYGMEQIGLRFFTVYGPWGRPDMAYWSFTEKILKGEPIQVFNHGKLQRDFTYIDDIVAGIVAVALERPAVEPDRLHRIYNIGNNRPVELMRFIEIIEECAGQQAKLEFKPMQQGDVHATYADVDRLARDYGYRPDTPLESGMERFVGWYRQRYGYPAAAERGA